MVQFISSIRIKNFRSIVDQRLQLSKESLSIYVGRNDAGKSNVLRALNLFFNGQTDFGTPYRYDDDYSFVAATGTGKAKEILVDLTIEPPERLKNARTIRWIKRWRGDGTQLEEIKFKGGRSVGTNQRYFAMGPQTKISIRSCAKGNVILLTVNVRTSRRVKRSA